MAHIPVLLKEVLEIFNPQPGEIYIDATVDGGGHARSIAERVGPRGKVLGIDMDCEIIREAGIRNKESGIKNIQLVCASYANIRRIAEDFAMEKVNGILFDLGFSSYHIEQSGRGFSFEKNEPLDMRYNPRETRVTAEEIVNRFLIIKETPCGTFTEGDRFTHVVSGNNRLSTFDTIVANVESQI